MCDDTLKSSNCGAEGSRTPDLSDANAALYQLSYGPEVNCRLYRDNIGKLYPKKPLRQRCHKGSPQRNCFSPKKSPRSKTRAFGEKWRKKKIFRACEKSCARFAIKRARTFFTCPCRPCRRASPERARLSWACPQCCSRSSAANRQWRPRFARPSASPWSGQ